MVLTSGYYRGLAASGSPANGIHLVLDPEHAGRVVPARSNTSTESHIKLRRDKDSWLSIDDGEVGKHGTPEHLRVLVGNRTYRVWVEQRGKDQFGLIPTDESGEYSNTFLAVSGDSLRIVDEWNTDNGSIWVVSSKWEGPAGV